MRKKLSSRPNLAVIEQLELAVHGVQCMLITEFAEFLNARQSRKKGQRLLGYPRPRRRLVAGLRRDRECLLKANSSNRDVQLVHYLFSVRVRVSTNDNNGLQQERFAVEKNVISHQRRIDHDKNGMIHQLFTITDVFIRTRNSCRIHLTPTPTDSQQ